VVRPNDKDPSSGAPTGKIVPLTLEADCGGAAADYQRTEHGREDGDAEDDGAAGDDGAGGCSGSGLGGELSDFHGVPGGILAMPQSIEAALSTFLSAHHESRSAVAAGGCAFAGACWMSLDRRPIRKRARRWRSAVVSHFLKAGAWSLISTHHTSLKVYAANTDGVLNAAAGVDEVTLAPNYKLRLGVPGAFSGHSDSGAAGD